jgi:hypothetical protein
MIDKKTQVLDVSQCISVSAACELFGCVYHRRAEVHTKHLLCPATQQHPAEAAFTASTIEHLKSTNVSKGREHRLV